jgi:hypothetical protein
MARPENVRGMLGTAETFRRAGRILNDNIPKDLALSAPSIVLAAFALEIYLKAFIALEKGAFPGNTHDLASLFSKLSKESQDGVKRMWAYGDPNLISFRKDIERQMGVSYTFDERLKMSAKAFIGFRYSFEGNNSSFIAGDILESVRSYMINKFSDEFEAVNGSG